MELTITPELETLIQRKLDSGEYETPQQVLENAVYRLNFDDAEISWDTAEPQAAIDKGWEEAERGETMSGEEARKRLAILKKARKRD